jgi:hypothetical protein
MHSKKNVSILGAFAQVIIKKNHNACLECLFSKYFEFFCDIFYLLLNKENFITPILTVCLSFGIIDRLYKKSYK